MTRPLKNQLTFPWKDYPMIKLKGPMQSIEGMGSIADVLTYSKKGDQQYAKKHARPANPRTDYQVAIRALMTFLALNWRHLTQAEQLTWKPTADRNGVAPYHAFVAANHNRWTNWLAPSKEDPATETPPNPAMNTITAFLKNNHPRLRIWPPAGAQPWGEIIYRSQTPGFTAARTNARFILLHDTPTDLIVDDYEVEAGTYYYRGHAFSPTGGKSFLSTQRTVTVL